MRGVAILLVLSGCGRIAFDPHTDGATGNDGHGDAAPGCWQLVTNGGFETGDLSGWTLGPSINGRGIVVQTPVVAGSWAVEMRPSFTFIGPNTISTSVTVVPGTRYVLSAYFHAEGLTGAQLFYVDLEDAPFETEISAVNGALGWQFVSAVIDVPAAVNSVTVRVVRDDQRIEPAFADEIALTPAASFTPPSMCM